MEDPRDDKLTDPLDVLTEDSEDELADLEKEFANRKARLLSKRKERKHKLQVQVPRSPSPTGKRRKTEPQPQPQPQPQPHDRRKVDLTAKTDVPNVRAFQKVVPSSFAKRLHEIEQTPRPEAMNYKERFFEFEKVPEKNIVACSENNCKDAISGEVLSRRFIEKDLVEQFLASVKVLRVCKLLAKVYAPKFEEPIYVNWCLTGIIMHKSTPKTTANNSKYMALRVGLFANTVDVMLFGDAFKKYWKLQCGEVVAILNPTIKKLGVGFSLSLNDDLDSVLEIGTLKHYARCLATTKKGERCKYVVDALKNELCSFHEESKFKLGSRMELQGSVKPKAPRDKSGNLSQMCMSRSPNRSLYVSYESTGFQEKDIVYTGGEQFDESKFDRPIVESAAAKLRKQRANQKFKLQLLTGAAPGKREELQKLGIVDLKSETGSNIIEAHRMQTYNCGLVRGLAYDPVAGITPDNEKIVTKKSQMVQELRRLCSDKCVNLRASAEEHSAKMQQRQRALNLLNIKKTSKAPILPGPGSKNKRPKPHIATLDEEAEKFASHSDNDIEIAFANESEKGHYLQICLQDSSGG